MSRRAPARALAASLVPAVLAVAACRAEDEPASATTTLLPAGAGDDADGDGPPSALDTVTSTTFPVDDESAIESTVSGDWLLTPAGDLTRAGDPPPILVSVDGRAVRATPAATTEVDGLPTPVGAVVGDGAGLVAAEEVEVGDDGVSEQTGIVAVPSPGAAAIRIPVPTTATVDLHDVVVVDGTPHVLYARFDDAAATTAAAEASGHLVLHDVATGAETVLATAAAPELFLSSASAGPSAVALSYTSDLTEVVAFVDLAGREIERPGPTDSLPYDAPPFVQSAVFSADGAELAHLEGPDVDGSLDPEDQRPEGDWEVVVTDAEGEQLRLVVADGGLAWAHLDFDGRWLLLSGGTADGPVEPLLVDTESVALDAYLVAGVRGAATLDAAAVAAL